MKIGEQIKKIRKEKNISVDYIAKQLGVSKTTIYRYEDSSIEKIPVSSFDKLCSILGVSPAELMGNSPNNSFEYDALPPNFDNATDAMAFILKSPILAAFGGYDPAKMSDETIIEFANEILDTLKYAVYKHNTNQGKDRL